MPSIRRALAPVLLAAAALFAACAARSALASSYVIAPQPLLSLYKHSARVVVARVGASEVVRTEGSLALVRTALHVTEEAKGSGERLVNLYLIEMVEPGGEPSLRFPLSDNFESAEPRLKKGERYLFFLDRREAGDGYEVNYESYGIKPLTDDGLKVYLERMRELAAITRREPEDKAALVEWLVRCAEEPATRWEGASELQRSALAHKIREAPAAVEEEEGEEESAGEEEEADNAEPAEEPEESDEQGSPAADDASKATPSEAAAPAPGDAEGDGASPLHSISPRFTPPDPSLAPLLSEEQRRRLADALFGAREMGEGEGALLMLVRDFGDARFAGFVLAQLHRVEDDPPRNAYLWLRALVETLGDQELVEAADEFAYGPNYGLPDEEFPAPEDGPASAAVQPKESAAAEAPAPGSEATPERTRRKRAALKALLSRAEQFIATGAPPPKPAQPAAPE